jgi:hypothetical protein
LRNVALGAFNSLAKDDSELQEMLIPLVDDPDRNIRFNAWNAVGTLKIRKALPALEARLGREDVGFSPLARETLERVIKALKEGDTKTASTSPFEPSSNGQAKPKTASSTTDIADIERQAAELEKQARELRTRIESLKRAPAQVVSP